MSTTGGLRCCWPTSAALPPRATERAPIPSPTRSFEGKPTRSGGAAAPDSEAGRSESANEDVRAARGRRRTAARTNSDAIAANRDLDRVSQPQETTPPTMRRAPPRPDRYRIPHDRSASLYTPITPHPVARVRHLDAGHGPPSVSTETSVADAPPSTTTPRRCPSDHPILTCGPLRTTPGAARPDGPENSFPRFAPRKILPSGGCTPAALCRSSSPCQKGTKNRRAEQVRPDTEEAAHDRAHQD